MGKKLHQRFAKVEPWDRDSFRCEKCDKIRAICCDCGQCSECCECDYCDLCGLPNGQGLIECTCFQCDECHKTFPENDQVVDDGDYISEVFNPRKPLQYICAECYQKRKLASKKDQS